MDGGGEGMEWLCGADERWMCTHEKVARKKKQSASLSTVACKRRIENWNPRL